MEYFGNKTEVRIALIAFILMLLAGIVSEVAPIIISKRASDVKIVKEIDVLESTDTVGETNVDGDNTLMHSMAEEGNNSENSR